ncbi:MAG: protease modulator HflK family protein [Deltaproteobacteria bacterium]|nr:protease modulator HflK family protein [Deltaproteobacteria bacterium]
MTTETTITGITDSQRTRDLVNASFLAMGVDVFLVSLKYALAYLTNNAVLLADALHSCADFAVSLVVLISILVKYIFHGSRRARYAEALVSFLISLLLIFGSYEMFLYVWKADISKFILITDIPLIIAFTGISIVLLITLKMSEFKKRIGAKYNSDAFSAEGDHTFSDFLSSVSVWITLLLGYFGVHIERLISLLIGLVVLNIGIRLFFTSVKRFGFKFSFLSKIIDKVHIDIVNRLRSVKKQLSSTLEKCGLKFLLLPGMILNKMRAWIFFNASLIVVLYLGTGFYVVLPYQTGLELLFGKVVKENSPGLHFHLPKPFGNALLVDTSAMIRLESGFRTDMNYSGAEPEMYLWENMHSQGRYTKVPEEALAIAGDENLIDLNFICYYLITDPVQYALNIENAHEILRNLFVHEIHSICGRYALDDLLTSERNEIQANLLSRMSLTANNLIMGVDIKKVYMQEVHPPVEVIPEYRNISSAKEKKDEIIHQASAYSNDLVPRSRGEAIAMIMDSKAYAEEKLNNANGETRSYLLKEQNFSRYKTIQKTRLWWEAVEKVLKDKTLYILPSKAQRRFIKNDDNRVKNQ